MNKYKDSQFHCYLSVPIKSLLTATAAELDVPAVKLLRESIKWYCRALLEKRNRLDVYEYNYLGKLSHKYAQEEGEQ
jgi:hypothetical protein